MIAIFAANLLSPNLGLVVWLSIVFGLLLWILKRFAWGPITGALEDRERTIDDALQRAEKALEESRQLAASNESARRDAEREAHRIVHAAREEAERVRADEVQNTREEIKDLRLQAQEDIARERDGALEALRKEVALLAIQAAEHILRENLDTERQRGLVDRFIRDYSPN